MAVPWAAIAMGAGSLLGALSSGGSKKPVTAPIDRTTRQHGFEPLRDWYIRFGIPLQQEILRERLNQYRTFNRPPPSHPFSNQMMLTGPPQRPLFSSIPEDERGDAQSRYNERLRNYNQRLRQASRPTGRSRGSGGQASQGGNNSNRLYDAATRFALQGQTPQEQQAQSFFGNVLNQGGTPQTQQAFSALNRFSNPSPMQNPYLASTFNRYANFSLPPLSSLISGLVGQGAGYIPPRER